MASKCLWRLLILIVVVVVAAVSGPTASSQPTSCDGASAYIAPTEEIASTSATLVARITVQGCVASFSFLVDGPSGTLLTPSHIVDGRAGQVSESYRLPVTGLEPGANYHVTGDLTYPLPFGMHYPSYPYTGRDFTTLARLDVILRGKGAVKSSPAGIDCGTACGLDLPIGGGVTLLAIPEAGYRFGHWEGDACSGASPTCAAWVTSWARTTAVFDQVSLVTVSRDGTGSGVVTGPAGITCGTTCSATLDPGQQVALQALADAGARFDRWTGACTGSGPTCTFTSTVGTNAVGATFVKQTTLTVRRTGLGTVTSDVGGVRCGPTCSTTVDEGSTVSLRAAAARGRAFAGWSGDCAGKRSVCTLAMDGPRTAGARFVKPKAKAPKRKKK